MSKSSLREKGISHEGVASQRSLTIGENVVVFEGVRLARSSWGRKRGLDRQDRLLMADLPGTPLSVRWRNWHRFPAAVCKRAIDPFDQIKPGSKMWSKHQIFTAMLDLSPAAEDALWGEQEDTFDQSDDSISLGETPRQQYLRELISELAHSIKLEAYTPNGTYVATAESKTARPITYSQFRPYGWQLFGNQPPEATGLYLPDVLAKDRLIDGLSALFTVDDPDFILEDILPQTGGIPTQPLVTL